MNGLALCAGYGGIELGLALAIGDAYRTVCYCERDAYAAATLVARMEDEALDRAPVWDDLKTLDGGSLRGRVDIITGGYPCQPFSLAGKRLGADDERHLWPDILRLVREIRPTFCFFENVAAHLSMGFEAVRGDLRGDEYEVEAGIYSAQEMGDSQRRDRLFILAYRLDNGHLQPESYATGRDGFPVSDQEIEQQDLRRKACGCGSELADTVRNGAHEECGESRGKTSDTARDKRRRKRSEPCHSCGKLEHANSARGETEQQRWNSATVETGRGLVNASGIKTGSVRGGSESELARSGHTGGYGVGNAEHGRRETGQAETGGRPEHPSQGLADAHSWNDSGRSVGAFGEAEFGSPFEGAGAWPPGPSERAVWDGIIGADPRLAPSITAGEIKRVFCGVAHGDSFWMDRSRLCGNGVVPVVAAFAFLDLAARLRARLGNRD